jgi:hypothetical protein
MRKDMADYDAMLLIHAITCSWHGFVAQQNIIAVKASQNNK